MGGCKEAVHTYQRANIAIVNTTKHNMLIEALAPNIHSPICSAVASKALTLAANIVYPV